MSATESQSEMEIIINHVMKVGHRTNHHHVQPGQVGLRSLWDKREKSERNCASDRRDTVKAAGINTAVPR